MNSTNNTQLLTWLKTLDIIPKNLSHYKEAITHSSYANEHKLNYDYEKLEFLGDTIIEYLTVLFLYKYLENEKVGKLTESKILIVQGKTFVKAGYDIGLDKQILLGAGFKKTDDLSKILEDCFEALVAAIYLDHGLIKAQALLEKTIFSYFKNHQLDDLIDYKSLIQVAMVKHSKSGINYKYVALNNNVFEVQLCVNNIVYGVGYGKNKKDAEKQAAKDAYSKLAFNRNGDK